jgi:hypothetical protein
MNFQKFGIIFCPTFSFIIYEDLTGFEARFLHFRIIFISFS